MASATIKRNSLKVRLGDVANQVRYKVADPASEGITHYLPGGGVRDDSFHISEWLSVDDGVMGPAFQMRFLPGHTLYKSRVPHGVGVADRKGICANTTYVIEANPEKLLPELLPFILITDQFRQFEKDNNRGSTNLFLNYNQIAEYEFHLPPLDEQRHIADLLWAFFDVQNSLEEARDAATKLFTSLLHEVTLPRPHWRNIALGKAVQIDISRIKVEGGEKYRMCGVLGFGKGLFENGIADSKSTKYKFLHRLQVDQLVFRKITAWESPIAIVTSNFDGYFVSPEFPTFTLDKNQISPSFMSILYKTEQFKKEMQARCTGTLLRRMRLNPSELLKIPVSLPPLDEQKEVVVKLEALQNTLSSIAQHLNSTRRLMKLALEKRLS